MIKNTVAQLIREHGTNNPYEIAAQRNVFVHFEQLGEMFGYFSMQYRIVVIHINSGINEQDQRFTCAHELGHRILHPDVNTPFLRRNTLLSVDRIEREANQFAVELLLPDRLLYDGLTIYEAAAICGVPEEIAHLKKI